MSNQSERIEELERELTRIRGEAANRLFDHLSDMVISVGPDGAISGLNKAARLQAGLADDGLVGRPVSTLFDAASGDALQGLCQSQFQGSGDSEVRLQDGRTMSFSIIRLDLESAHVVLRDVSQRERVEAELLYARRMASVGRLSAEVAHEINNPLAVIQGRVEMLRALPDMSPAARGRHLDILQEHSHRIARIVQNLQVFARPRVPQRALFCIQTIVDGAVKTLGRQLERFKIVPDIAEELTAYVDQHQFGLVIQNLLTSMVEISPHGSTFGIFADLDTGGGGVDVRITTDKGAWPAELLLELRSPYSGGSYQVDPGSGLALAISWGIIQEHGGWLTAQNMEPSGAQVEIRVPNLMKRATDTIDLAQKVGREALVILVVDDDLVICETVSWMISAQGNRSVVVHSAEEALVRLENEEFDVILTDQRLPGMDGESLLQEINERWPELTPRTILTSGLLHRPKEDRRYLQKPFSREQLAKILSELNQSERKTPPK
jgi:two-component system cell cycle sensor histidine kinase/response regulator CckA